MRLERLELAGFKSFAKKTTLVFDSPIVAIVGPNGSGKSNVAEACRWVLGEQSLKSLRGKRSEDFIWHGSPAAARANRGSATMVFDNHGRYFPIEAATVEINREIHRDGASNYSINRSSVRLKDLTELLHRVSIGAPGYHIISQGEADKILTSSPIDRRAMVETALGLRFYEWQLFEAERKLQKTAENLRQAELLRREIAPHLKFLKKEMEKIEKTREWRQELKQLARRYFSRERLTFQAERARLDQAARASQARLEHLSERLSRLKPTGAPVEAGERSEQALSAAEKHFKELAGEREALARRLGRLEGMLEVGRAGSDHGRQTVEVSRVSAWVLEIETIISQAAWSKLSEVVTAMKKLIQSTEVSSPSSGIDLETERVGLLGELARINGELERVESEIKTLRQALERETAARTQVEHGLVALKFEAAEAKAKFDAVAVESERLKILETELEQALNEVVALTDRELLEIAKDPLAGETAIEAPGDSAEQRRRIERLKLRLEESGVSSNEVITEYEQVAAREGHLAREAADLEASTASLEQVIRDLKQKIDQEFQVGLERINREFQNFFQLLFGGGQAKLAAVKIADEVEAPGAPESVRQSPGSGLEIDISLPRKRIQGLEMLSGGERSLTSIALLFALSRVHPPPFMILDETDAALDEANSKKYGDMVEQLAKETQLILITHNRETMSRAEVIYGVTMGADGISRLLSIKFDEALSYAKT